ncbi:MAG: DUF1269 domain-containing protein [Oscillochloridaceae bacterium]|nr:DUF1269 domain-containing protein [Chloroflexaceae bacterium]MDW8389194.1 DUF1269 domain-containing protein [Oscillochloridaceae bacterium]
MATLTVFKFPTPDGAEQTLSKLQDLQKQQLITILDAAIVTWPADKKKPRTRQLYNLAGAGALTGAFWGMLFGLIFLMPFMGALIGAATGAITGSFADVGIDDNFIKEVREKVVPGTSALFLMSADEVVDRIRSELGTLDAELIASNLSTEQEAKLREIFSEE